MLLTVMLKYYRLICTDNKILVLNNLKTCNNHFVSDKTYWKSDVWIYELDVCVVLPQLLDSARDFSLLRRSDLPSDHAPINITLYGTSVDLDNLLVRATSLGGHATLLRMAGRTRLTKTPIKHC